MFKKGAKPGPGRPVGCKNKNCMRPVFWYNLIEERSAQMTDKEVVEIAFRALELLMPKVPSIPGSPDDSVSNAMNAFQAMNNIVPINGPTIPMPNSETPNIGPNGGR